MARTYTFGINGSTFDNLNYTYDQLESIWRHARETGDIALIKATEKAIDKLFYATEDVWNENYNLKEPSSIVIEDEKFDRKKEIEYYRDFEWRLYGQFINGIYQNIFPSTKQVRGCFCETEIEKLLFRLHQVQYPRKNKEGYWGWINYSKEKLESVWKSKNQTLMCLKHTDYKKLEEEGLGLLVYLTATSLGVIKKKVPKPLRPERKIIWKKNV